MRHDPKPYAVIMIVLLVVVMVTGSLAQAATSYQYYSRIDVVNSGTSDVTGRFLVTINSASLIDGAYCQSDADDVAVTGINGSEYVTAKNLTSATATWILDYSTVPAQSTITKTLWFGNSTATRNQVWIANTSDTLTVGDSASLDITTNLTVSGDFYISATPSGTIALVEKSSAYGLICTATPSYGFYVTVPGSSATASAAPNAAGNRTELTPSAGNNWECVDTVGADYVSTSTSDKEDVYNVSTPSVPADAVITKVEVYWNAKNNGGSLSSYSFIRLDGSEEQSTAKTTTLSYVYYSHDFTSQRPGGGSWTVSDLTDVQIGQGVGTTGAFGYFCNHCYLYVEYYQPQDEIVYASATLGVTKTVKGTYDGSHVRLYIDDVLQTSATVSGAIEVNGQDVVLSEITGYCDDINIGDTSTGTPTWRLDLDFEPDEIGSSTIDDQSASNNDATYALAANPAGITVTVNEILGYSAYTYTASQTTDTMDLIDSSVVQEPTNYTTPGTFDALPGADVINSVLDEGGIPRNLFWLSIILAVAILGGLFIYARTRHLFALAVMTNSVVIFSVGVGMLDWWVIPMYMMFTLAMLINERTYEVT